MMKPMLVVVADHLQNLETIQRELVKRYADDYGIICEQSAEAALQRLEALRAAGGQVVILLAALGMASMTGIEYLARAHDLHPHAKRVLLIPWGNRSETKPVLKAISLGQFDRYVTTPSRSPDEEFHSLIAELLRDWQRRQPEQRVIVTYR
jgi:thioredoxin reductase (NADPH)